MKVVGNITFAQQPGGIWKFNSNAKIKKTSQQNPWQFLVNLNLLSGRSTSAKCQCKVSLESQSLRKVLQMSHLFPQITPFLQPFVNRICICICRCVSRVAASQVSLQGHCSRNGSRITSPNAPLSGVTSALRKHLLSALAIFSKG